MALLRTKEIRAMDAAAREKKLTELRDELMHERGVAAMGGAPPNPGKIRALRKNIARIHSIETQEARLGSRAAAETPAPSPKEKAPKRAGRKPAAAKEPQDAAPDEDADDTEAEP